MKISMIPVSAEEAAEYHGNKDSTMEMINKMIEDYARYYPDYRDGIISEKNLSS